MLPGIALSLSTLCFSDLYLGEQDVNDRMKDVVNRFIKVPNDEK